MKSHVVMNIECATAANCSNLLLLSVFLLVQLRNKTVLYRQQVHFVVLWQRGSGIDDNVAATSQLEFSPELPYFLAFLERNQGVHPRPQLVSQRQIR